MWGNVTLSRHENDGGMKVMSRSDSPEVRLTKERINRWAGAIDGSSLGNKDALKECIQRQRQQRRNRRAEPVKQEQLSHYVCQEEQLHYPGVRRVHRWRRNRLCIKGNKRTFRRKCPSVHVVRHWSRRGGTLMFTVTHTHTDKLQPLRTHWWLIVTWRVIQPSSQEANWWITFCIGDVIVRFRWKRVAHVDFWVIAYADQRWRISYDGRHSPRWHLWLWLRRESNCGSCSVA